MLISYLCAGDPSSAHKIQNNQKYRFHHFHYFHPACDVLCADIFLCGSPPSVEGSISKQDTTQGHKPTKGGDALIIVVLEREVADDQIL